MPVKRHRSELVGLAPRGVRVRGRALPGACSRHGEAIGHSRARRAALQSTSDRHVPRPRSTVEPAGTRFRRNQLLYRVLHGSGSIALFSRGQLSDLSFERRKLVGIGVPLMGATLVEHFLSMADAIMLGRYSSASFSGVALGSSVSWLLSLPTLGLVLACAPEFGRLFREDRDDVAQKLFRGVRRTSVMLALPWVVVSLLAARVFTVVPIDQAIGAEVEAYLIFRCPAPVLWALFYLRRGLLQSSLRPKLVLVSVLISGALNVLLNALLIFGDPALVRLGMEPVGLMPLGALGAGLATTIAHVVMVLILEAMGRRSRGKPTGTAPLPVNIRRLFVRVGLPISLEMLATQITTTLVMVMIAPLGAVALSTFAVYGRLTSLGVLASMGLAAGLTVYVSRATRAREPRRYYEAALQLVVALALAVALAGVFARTALFSIFTDRSAVLAECEAVSWWGFGFVIANLVRPTVDGLMQGFSDTRPVLMVRLVVDVAYLSFLFLLMVFYSSMTIGIVLALSFVTRSVQVAALLRVAQRRLRTHERDHRG